MRYDKAGQLTYLTGAGYGSSQTDFTSTNIPVKYRAWGGIKEINFGDNLKSTYSYGTRLQPTSYRLLNAQSQVQDGSDFQYYPDNRIKFASNLVASNPSLTVASAFDRGYKFDHAGRLEEALTGLEASGGSAPSPPSVNLSPYKQVNTYDVWGNLTSRTNRFWRSNPNDSATYVNNRRQGASYDNTGNMLDDGFIKSFFDTANRQVRSETWTPPVGGGQTGNPSMPSVEIDQNLDGHGLRAKRVETKRTEEFVNGGPQTTITTTVTTTYYVRSSLAGGDIALELDGQGNKVKGYIYALGGRLAEHWTAFNGVLWRHTNPVTGTMLQGAERSEFDPLGAEVGNYDPWVNDPTPTYQELKGSEPLYIEGGDPFNARSGCTLDGLPISCSQFLRRVDNGSVHAQNPNGSTPLTHLGGGLVVGSYHRDAGFADAVATDSNGRSERFPVRVLDQIGFSKWLGIRAGSGLTGGQDPRGKSGHGGSSDRNVPPGATGGTNFPCASLARNAQMVADRALKSRGGVADRSAVEEFDGVMSWLYVGIRLDTWEHAMAADRGLLGDRVIRGDSTIGEQDRWGQRDFKDKFQEPGFDGIIRDDTDQTHHAVAHMSLGINGNAYISLGHLLLDDNTADKRLSSVSFAIGSKLRGDPDKLKNIGQTIFDTLCK